MGFRTTVLVMVVGAAPLLAQDAASIWQGLERPAFDPDKAAAIREVTLLRDRIRITFVEGAIQLARPAAGAVFGAAFHGRGRVEISPAEDTEKQQLRLFTGKDTLDMTFTEAAFVFTDGVAEELGSRVQWAPSADNRPGRLYQERQEAREDAGAELLPRLFKGILSGDRKRTALFAADLKTADKGWVHIRFDALDLEETSVGRWSNWGGFTGFDRWLSFPAGEKKATEVFRDPFAREDFRIRSYRIDAAVTAGAELHATTQVTLDHRTPGERVLLFDLDANLRVESVKDARGATLPFFQPRDPKDRNQSYGDYVAVVLPEPAKTGQQQALEFRYGGKRVIRKHGSGNFFCQSYGWYPGGGNHFAARADFEMTFRSPKRYTLVATGAKTGESVDGDVAVTSWKSDLPLAVAGFAFGDYKLHLEKVGSVAVEIYANRQPDDVLRAIQDGASNLPGEMPSSRPAIGSLTPARLGPLMATEMGNMLRLFEIYFGPYPYKRLAVTNIPYPYGQGWPMLIYLSAISFMDSTQRQALGITQHTELTDFFRAHEASHQWWGHRVGWKSYHDQWISEGFAQFSGNLYVLFRQNEKEFVSRLRQDKQELLTRDQKNRSYESLGPVWMGQRLSSADAPAGYARVIYNKGGLILNMLRSMLLDPRSQQADARFAAMMRDFCSTFHNQPASTEDFKVVAEKHMLPAMDLDGNGRLDWFFRQYVYGTGIPEYQFQYKVQETGGGKWRVAATVTPKKVPPGWKDLLRLYLHANDRAVRLGWIPASDKEQTHEFELPLKPQKISINHNEDTLADIRQ